MHPRANVGQRVFESLKPIFFKTLKNKNTCCCIYHTKLNELRLALNLMRTNNTVHGNIDCDCACDVVCGIDGQPCQAPSNIYKGRTKLWEAIICPKSEFDELHNRSYLFGDYSSVGYNFYHCAQWKFLGLTLFWYNGSTLLLKRLCPSLVGHWRN